MNATETAPAAHKPNGKSGTVNRIFRCKRCEITQTIVTDVTRRYLGTDKWGAQRYSYTVGGVGSVVCTGCGRDVYGITVKGRHSDKHTCGAKCLASKGPNCECSCGGKNHGAGFVQLAGEGEVGA